MSHKAIASSSDSPTSRGKKSVKKGESALEKHVSFFDRNKDGVIYPWETYQGFRAIGAGFLMSAFAAVFINLGLSQKSRPGKRFSPLLPIEVKNSRLCIHGSRTGAYDKDGRFVESKFEDIFKKHAHTHKDALTYKEIKQMYKTNREPIDFGGWLAAYGEWEALIQICKDKNGLLTKDTIRGVYDGSLFQQLEKQRLSSSPSNK